METKTKELRPANTFGVQFIVRQDKLRDGKAPVYARITVNGEIIHFALKQWIDPRFWDVRKGYGKGSKDEVALLNDGLEQVRVALAHHYQQLQLKGKFITPNAVKDAYLGHDGEELNLLSRLVTYHFETAKAVLEWSTLKHYSVTQRYLIRFLEGKYKKKDIFLHEIKRSSLSCSSRLNAISIVKASNCTLYLAVLLFKKLVKVACLIAPNGKSC